MSEANVMYMQECGIKLMSVPTPRGVHFPRPTSRGQVNLGSGLLAYSVGGEGQVVSRLETVLPLGELLIN